MAAERRRSLEVMRCVKCGRVKAWTDGFPHRIEAICWECAYAAHHRLHHPKKWWHRLRI